MRQKMTVRAAASIARAGAFNADTAAFLRKWMRDVVDTQHPRGGFAASTIRSLFSNSWMS